MRRARFLALVHFLLLSLFALGEPGYATAPEVPPVERWYEVQVGGEVAGWAHESESQQGDVVITASKLDIRMRRGGSEVRVRLASTFTESVTGVPLAMSSRQELGQLPLELEYRFRPGRLELDRRQGAAVSHESLPLPAGSWLTPAAANRRIRAAVAASLPSFEILSLDPSLGPEPFLARYERRGDASELALAAGAVKATEYRLLSAAYGGGATIYLDQEGVAVRTIQPFAGLAMVLTRSTGPPPAAGGPGPEVMVPTFVRPSRPIAAPRQLLQARYRLRFPAAAEAGMAALAVPPSAGGQRAEAAEDGSWLVTVSAAAAERSNEARTAAADELPDPAPFLEASSYLNDRDPAVARLAAAAGLAAASAPRDRALALRAFVHREVRSRDLGTGFATASEVAARREGDCTEHAVLLAALLRAEGIPSRVVVGLLYAEAFAGAHDIFAFHMWAQAWVDGRWLDLDAITDRPFDAAHLALASSALSDREGISPVLAPLAALAGGLTIDVLETSP